MSKKHEQFAYRLSHILKQLNSGTRLDVQQLANEFDITPRTVQRDLNERLGFLEWNERGPRYYSLDKAKIGHLLPEDIERFARFCSIQELQPKSDNRFYQKPLTQSIQVKRIHYEDIKSREHQFNQIQQAIEAHSRIEFNYIKAGQERGKYYLLEPYALVNRAGVWYLIGIDTAEGKQKTFVFRQIRSLAVQSDTFTHNPELLAAIHGNDSISHGNQLAEVIVQIAPKAAPYFQRRQLLPNQELIRKLDDGGLLLACKNINEMEIIPIVQYWIPHLIIISPSELQEKLIGRLKAYLADH